MRYQRLEYIATKGPRGYRALMHWATGPREEATTATYQAYFVALMGVFRCESIYLARIEEGCHDNHLPDIMSQITALKLTCNVPCRDVESYLLTYTRKHV